MAIQVAELTARLSADVSPLQSAMQKAEKTVSSGIDKIGATGEKLQDFGKKMSTRLTLPIVALAGVATNAASDLNESLSKVGVVFGGNAKDIESWSKSAAKNLGISRQKALEAAGTFGNLFRTMGLGGNETSKMSKDVVQLASDLGSFNNIDPTEALEKLRAGLVGEAEPLRSLGVNINEAAVKAKAMQLGLADASGELSESAKVQARYALIVEQTTTAQGDFARTANGLANSTRTAKAEAEDAAASFGKALQPIMTRVTEIVGGLSEKFGALSPGVQTTILVVAGLAAAIGPLVTVIGALSTAMAFLAANPIVLIIAGIAALAAALVIAYQKSETFRNIVQAVFGWIADHWPLLAVIIGGPIGAAIALLIKNFDSIKDAVLSVWNFVKPILDKIGDAIGKVAGPLGKVVGVVGGAAGKVGGLVGKLPGFADGGVVPGPIGAAMPAIVHGGETIIPAGGGGGGVTINVSVSALDPRSAADAVVQALREWERSNGPASRFN